MRFEKEKVPEQFLFGQSLFFELLLRILLLPDSFLLSIFSLTLFTPLRPFLLDMLGQ